MQVRAYALALLVGCSSSDPEVIEISDDAEVETLVSDSATPPTTDSAEDTVDTAPTPDTTIETSMDETSTDSAAVVDSMTDANTDGVTDTRVDAVEASTCVGSDPVCDCDGDGDKAKDKTGCGGGGDCDDGDPRRNSKVTSFLSDVPVGHAGDWDCNGTVTKEYAEGINCASYLTLTTGCSQQGYKGTPACGTTATLVQCKAGPLTNCVDGTTTTVSVKCK